MSVYAGYVGYEQETPFQRPTYINMQSNLHKNLQKSLHDLHNLHKKPTQHKHVGYLGFV
jgi:hypothetical protein